MESELLIDELNRFTNNEYKFELKSAVLNSMADFCVIEIFYRDGILLESGKKQEFETLMLGVLPTRFKYEFRFVKKFISEERLETEICDYMKKNFPSITYKINSIFLDNVTYKINLSVDELVYEHAVKKHLKDKICEYFKSNYEDKNFECEIQVGSIVNINNNEKFIGFENDESDDSKLRKIDVSEIVEYVGEKIETSADYIKDKISPEESIVVCGKIKTIKSIIIKNKPKKEDEKKKSSKKAKKDNGVDENSEKYEKKLYKWVLEDFTGDLSCLFMSNKSNQSKLEKLEAGSEIIVRGSLAEDRFDNGLSLTVKDICYCKLPETFEEKIVYHKEKPFYEFVKPERIVTYHQNTLLGEIEDDVCDYLKNNKFVCYDLETTGLSYESGDRMIEIGAVKIENGKITENFATFVNPEKHIPERSTEINGITDDDVKSAPKDYEALQDFYKFTRDCIIIGYNNNSFDDVFLIGQSRRCRWNFDNKTNDVYKIAQKNVKGLKNYKLGTVAKALGVVLDNAHRAWYDALATAEIFLKIAKYVEE